MAKLSEYPVKAAADNSDIIPLVDAQGNKKITKENLLQGLPTAESVAIAAEAAKNEAISAGVGFGQSYKDVTAVRSPNVIYTNTTGKLIFGSIRCTAETAQGGDVFVDDVKVAGAYHPYQGSSTIFFVVKPDSIYEYRQVLGQVVMWTELS